VSKPLTVEASEAGQRLDAFLCRRNLVASAHAARRAIAAGAVRVDGRPGKKGAHLAEGQQVELTGPLTDRVSPDPAAELDLPVLYVDDDLVAVNKPAGVPSHPLRAHEGASAAGALLSRFPECASASPDSREGGLVHRLDRGTTGVLIAARNKTAWAALRAVMAATDCEKIYRAEVTGRFPTIAPGEKDFVSPGAKPNHLVVAVPIGRTGRHGARVKLGGGRQPLSALTQVALLEQRSETALVEARLHRGRTHQVRAHLSYLGIPVVGDSTYGQPEADPEAPSHLHLHAASISFRHPKNGQLLRIDAPLPDWACDGKVEST
jgi:23S rRNA pseudouridine1911/1915/1917 synthase